MPAIAPRKLIEFLATLVICGLLALVVYQKGYKNGANASAQAQVKTDQAVIDKRVADEAASTEKAQAALVQQQADTAKLNTTLQAVRSQLAQAQQDLSHATLKNTHSTVPVAGRCPGSAIGSADFIRLWDGPSAIGDAPLGTTGQALSIR